jgi:hypothetical protein
LSRILSPVTSLSNCANESRMLRVSRPIDDGRIELLSDRYEGHSSCIESFDDLGKVGEAPRQAVNLIYDNDVHFLGFDVFQQTLQCRPLHGPTGVSTIVVAGGDDAPAFLALAQNEGFRGFALGAGTYYFHIIIAAANARPRKGPRSLISSPFSAVRFAEKESRNAGMFRGFCGK